MHLPLKLLWLGAAIALAASLVTAAPTGAAGTSEPNVTVTRFIDGVSIPWDIAFTPDGAALVPLSNGPSIYVKRANGSEGTLSANLSDVNTSGEGGLMGLVIDPNFDQNRRFYTCQTTSNDVEVVSWTVNEAYTSATRVADPLVDGIDRSTGRHSGCRLRFGYEGYLWIATGDAAIGSTPQNLSSLAGKVLRVSKTTGAGHPDNPFASSSNANRRRVYSYGHRNIQGIDRRPCTNQMWTSEHGPNVDDEINLIVRGGNYGWNPVPGYNEAVPMTDFAEFPNARGAKWDSGSPTIALSGATWVKGADWGGWDGDLAGAALKNQRVRIFEFGNGDQLLDVDVPAPLVDVYGRLRAPQMGPDGSLYVTSDGDASVLKVTPANGPTAGNQDLDGDGFDDLVVGVPGENVGGSAGAGSFNVLFGSGGGLGTAGNEGRSQNNLRNAIVESGDELGAAIAYGDVDGDGTTDVVIGSPDENVGSVSNAGLVTVVCGRTNGVHERSSQSFSQDGSVSGTPESGDRFGSAVAVGDFDNDGYDDVAVGVPDENIGNIVDAGGVTILPGSFSGITTVGSVSFSQAGSVAGIPEAGDRFGAALAVGDFDGDGYDDLAVGVPGEDNGSTPDGGAVTVLYGSATGLREAGSHVLSQSGSLVGADEAGDAFGSALTVGDFDNDGRDDLAVGVPGEDVGTRTDAGAVIAVYGSGSGLSASGSGAFSQNGLPGVAENGDRFGAALASGDFDNDGRDDIVVGVPGENIGSISDSGAVVAVFGSASGLRTTGAQGFSQSGSVPGAAESNDQFGAALRAADFDNDGRDDIAIGAPGEDIGSRNAAGAVTVLYGTGSGLGVGGADAFSQSGAVSGRPEAGDAFGAAL